MERDQTARIIEICGRGSKARGVGVGVEGFGFFVLQHAGQSLR